MKFKLKWRRRKITKKVAVVETYIRVTACCEAPIQMREVGQELYAVCTGCRSYLGHIVMRPVATLATHFDGFLQKATQGRNLSTRFSEGERDLMFETYIKLLTEWAPEAARQALREHVPSEDDRKR